jgi:hypothetical protein
MLDPGSLGFERSTYSAEFVVIAPEGRGGPEVPEPETLSLLALGCGMIAFAMHRRGRRSDKSL